MLKLDPNPTFNAVVEIPVPGDKPAKVGFTFKHMTRKQFNEFQAENLKDVDAILRIAKDWDGVDAEFSRESVERLIDAYHGAAYAIADAYTRELNKARLGN